ncbi:WD40-repeat-containing domain protein [Parasitella parasitica]|nr:WD40-repeat-containing domain protein [Parasitella parasitica]
MTSNHSKRVRNVLPRNASRKASNSNASSSDSVREHRHLKRVNSSEDYIEHQDSSEDRTKRSHRRRSVDKASSHSKHSGSLSKSSATPSNAKSAGRKRSLSSNETKSAKRPKRAAKPGRPPRKLPLLSDTYILKYVLEGHAEINIPVRDKDDVEDSKDIWCCEFEPTANDSGPAQNLAICASYTVLFADTSQGKYVKKYTHVENQEIFYCMAWTRLEGEHLLDAAALDEEEEVRFCNVLAVAGRLGSIKLISPLQNECYRYLSGHQKAVLAMTFAKTEPRWLFTASADKTVQLWDIGSPTNTTDNSICLARFKLPESSGEPSAVSVSYDLSTLMVGCNNGDLVEFKITAAQLKQFKKLAESSRQNDFKANKGTKTPTVDRSIKFPAGDEWHEGYVDDIHILGQDGDNRDKSYNKIVSRGAKDMEILVWDPVGSTRTDANIEMSLDWPDAADCTGLRFRVIEKNGQKVLLAGEYDGQIFIYNIGNGRKSKTLADNSKEQFTPDRILAHSMSTEMIRDVTCSYDTKTIAAVDNNNNIFIWTSSSSR